MNDKQLEYFFETQSKIHSIIIRIYKDGRFNNLIKAYGKAKSQNDIMSVPSKINTERFEGKKNLELLDEGQFLLGYVRNMTTQDVILLGPVRFGELTDADITGVMTKYDFPIIMKNVISQILYSTPIMNIENFATLLSVFNLVINGTVVPTPQIMRENSEIKSNEEDFIETNDIVTPHSTGEYENTLWYCIKNGLVDEIDKINYEQYKGNVGKLGPTYLRSMKNALIALNTICLRAAISGGLDTETAYTLGNKYAQRIEAATSIADLGKISPALRKDYCLRVKNLSKPKIDNMHMYKATEYIQNNIYSKLSVSEIAKKVKISPVYLSALAKEHLKCTLPQYINRQKINEAKKLLRFTDKSLSEIATLLSFSSQSHFQNQFKKIRGITPMEYREKYRKSNIEI